MLDVHPIRTEADHRAALAEIAALMDARMGTSEGDRLDVLATLVEAYEAAHIQIEAPDPIAAIRFMMEQKQLSRRDLEPAIGSRARVAEVLNRRRALTLPMIRRLSRLLDIPADVLIQPYKTGVGGGAASPCPHRKKPTLRLSWRRSRSAALKHDPAVVLVRQTRSDCRATNSRNWQAGWTSFAAIWAVPDPVILRASSTVVVSLGLHR
jgi:HTH-type transcriptional regulator / antitoxin HigA